MMFIVGLSARSGAVFGNTGPFFYSQAFSVGGTQYGEALRGYDEFSITPNGFNPNADQTQASRSSFGNAFFVGTGELGLRVNQSLYLNTFFEGGVADAGRRSGSAGIYCARWNRQDRLHQFRRHPAAGAWSRRGRGAIRQRSWRLPSADPADGRFPQDNDGCLRP